MVGKLVVNSNFPIPTFFELLKSIKNAKAEWKTKTPFQKWCYFYGIGKAAYGLVKMPNLHDVTHVHWFAYCTFGYTNLMISLMLYTMFYYGRAGEIQMGLPSTCCSFILLGVCKKKNLLKISIEFVANSVSRLVCEH